MRLLFVDGSGKAEIGKWNARYIIKSSKSEGVEDGRSILESYFNLTYKVKY